MGVRVGGRRCSKATQRKLHSLSSCGSGRPPSLATSRKRSVLAQPCKHSRHPRRPRDGLRRTAISHYASFSALQPLAGGLADDRACGSVLSVLATEVTALPTSSW